MKLLLDTHLLLWFFISPGRLSSGARQLVEDAENELFFSPVNFYEIAVKAMKGSPDFQVDANRLHSIAVERGLSELALTTAHSLQVLHLPLVHKDPFDRLLLAQAVADDAFLLTVDAMLLQYPSHVMDAR